MELTLNLFWLLLAIPAIWIWRGPLAESAPDLGHPLRRLLVLGCVLIVLFPVVSATDDLQAMRPEMEESTGRDTPGNSHHGRSLASSDGSYNVFALLAARFLLLPEMAEGTLAVQSPLLLPLDRRFPTPAGRAPPSPYLG